MFDKLFDNVGKTIKTFAWVQFILGAVGSIITAIVMLKLSAGSILYALLIAVLGSLVFLIQSIFIYGFGELIESTQGTYDRVCAIESSVAYLCQSNTPDNSSQQSIEAPKGRTYSETLQNVGKAVNNDTTNTWICPHCGAHNPKNQQSCRNCGKYR